VSRPWWITLVCFDCNEVVVPTERICVVINDSDTDSGYVFVCPVCESDVIQRAPVALLVVLAAAGACLHDTRHFDRPLEAASPLTADHVEDLIRRIKSVEYLAAHAAREQRLRDT
jgi:hypothetical protein